MSYELKEYKILGYTTDFNVCDCCGKADLKGTISILAVNYDVVLHFGTTCAAKADKYDSLEAARKAKKEITAIVNEHVELMQFAGSRATKDARVKEIRIRKALTLDTCREDEEYVVMWTAVRDGIYKTNMEIRAKNKAERERKAARTPEQVEAEETAEREYWENWKAQRELNCA